jgi:hypothetical protein
VFCFSTLAFITISFLPHDVTTSKLFMRKPKKKGSLRSRGRGTRAPGAFYQVSKGRVRYLKEKGRLRRPSALATRRGNGFWELLTLRSHFNHLLGAVPRRMRSHFTHNLLCCGPPVKVSTPLAVSAVSLDDIVFF